ncbi:hypothetical protein BTVI_65669 [Pitangus sulphuratus]|nr:hypothetical protein BTVI_65669 [Pitangus sulphuratus]
MEDHGGPEIRLQPEQVDAPKRVCGPVGSPPWSSLLAVPLDLWGEEPSLEQVGDLMGDPNWSSSWRTVSHERDTILEHGKSVRSPPAEEEGAAQTPFPIPLCCWWGGGREIVFDTTDLDDNHDATLAV